MARGPGKGNTNNPKGKPPGTKNAKTLAWEKLGEVIINDGAERFTKVLNEMDDGEFTKNYLMILEYFKPKQQRSEVNSKQQLNVTWEEKKTYESDG